MKSTRVVTVITLNVKAEYGMTYKMYTTFDIKKLRAAVNPRL